MQLLERDISKFKLNLMRFIEFCAQHCLYSKPQLSVEGVLWSISGKKEIKSYSFNEPICLDYRRREWEEAGDEVVPFAATPRPPEDANSPFWGFNFVIIC